MILGILQARMSSTRLPGKVLEPILGRPMLERQIERLRRARRIDRLVVATSTEAADDAIQALCVRVAVECFRGSLDDVLDRFYRAAQSAQPDHIVRLTADCPLTDPALIDHIVEFYLAGGYDYASNTLEPTYPDGLDAEVFSYRALADAWREADLPSQREHVTPFIHRQPARYRVGSFKSARDLSGLRWTVDRAEDLQLVRRVYEALFPVDPCFDTDAILGYLAANPEVAAVNSKIERNEGMLKSLTRDAEVLRARSAQDPSERYRKSEALLRRALGVIPLGSQTFSKSYTQYPLGVSPYFITHGKGSRVWDVDGNEYVDFVNGLASVNLGYCDPDVTAAVRTQLERGTIFSLASPIELEVAEELVRMVPCAEMVRFGKNGSDATAGAVRLARAYTGRERVAVCGYHGWQDWYIGSTARHKGVPQAVRDLTRTFAYNDLASLEKVLATHLGQYAAVVLEPMNVVEPARGFLEGVRELTHAHGALLVFDETITGFRFANGGAQELFGVTPDLTSLGKGLANGYPLSAVTGKADVMRLMEEIFFSFTFGGEALSLAAGLATMQKLQREPVVETLRRNGQRVLDGVRRLIESTGVGGFLSISGNPTWTFLNFKDAPSATLWEIKTLFLQEVFARGILTIGTHNMSYAHTEADVDRLLQVYGEVLPLLREAVEGPGVRRYLRCEPLEPLFRVR